jgi:predicted TIM-barrel fold metal-dependent hydrolase
VDLIIDGNIPGYSYEQLKSELLDHYDFVGVLSTHDVGEWPANLNPYFVRETCRAANDWMAEEWLPHDDRFRGVIIVPWGEPNEAVKEMRRASQLPRMAGVLFSSNTLARPLGDPLYHPIFEAAEDLGLPLVLHPGLDQPTFGNIPVNGLDLQMSIPPQAQHYIASMITHGVFEKYPRLQVLINEYGVAWLPSLMWKLDEEYPALQLESPLVKRLPSEYIREHIKFGTQPFEKNTTGNVSVGELLGTVEGIEDMLCFSSDYPHFSMDEPEYISRLLPKEWHRKVFFENAASLFGWHAPAHDGEVVGAMV